MLQALASSYSEHSSCHSISHSVLYCLLLLLQIVKIVQQTLVQKFGVAAVRGVSRNKSIAEFQLEPNIYNQQIFDDILAQLTTDERKKFRVRRDANRAPSIELCPVGEWCMVMQCLRCVSQVLSQLYQRSSLPLPSWLCWLGGPALSCVLPVHHL